MAVVALNKGMDVAKAHADIHQVPKNNVLEIEILLFLSPVTIAHSLPTTVQISLPTSGQ